MIKSISSKSFVSSRQLYSDLIYGTMKDLVEVLEVPAYLHLILDFKVDIILFRRRKRTVVCEQILR